MSKKSSHNQSTSVHHPSTLEKGRLVEHIAARMHQTPGLKVETHVFLPARGTTGRKREIDVLLTSEFAAFPVRVAIECKNEKERIGSERIDAFIGKLDDVGIPPQQGIYISASGYTRDAIERATAAGIRPLILQGLANGALASQIAEAFQSVVYLVPQVITIAVTYNEGIPANAPVHPVFCNERGRVCGTAPGLIWQGWLAGEPPSTLGEYELHLPVPPGWYSLIGGRKIMTEEVAARVRVVGAVVTIPGQFTHHRLVNAATKTLERGQIDASFNPWIAQASVTTLLSEEELTHFGPQSAQVQIQIGRMRVPRLHIGPAYYPLSERVATLVTERMKAFERGEISDPRPFKWEEIEGTDIRTIWEPVWSHQPEAALLQSTEIPNHG